MIDDAVAGVARAVSGELAPRYGTRLVADVEAGIYANNGRQAQEQEEPGQYLDPVALGALIVAIAQFGYQVYTDRKNKGQQPTREAIAQAIRIERRKYSDLTGEEAEVIDIISRKIIEHADEKLPEATMQKLDFRSFGAGGAWRVSGHGRGAGEWASGAEATRLIAGLAAGPSVSRTGGVIFRGAGSG